MADFPCPTADFAKRDAAAALRFFRKAIRHHGEPEVVTIDKSGANTTSLATLNADKPEEESITVRQSKYLNNLIEQDHRNIKYDRCWDSSRFIGHKALLPGGLVHMIRKGQSEYPDGDGMSPVEQFYLLAA